MVEDGTLLPGQYDENGDNDGTMISHSAHGTLVPDVDNTLGSNLGTMVINSDGEDDDDSTMKRKILNSLFKAHVQILVTISYAIYVIFRQT